MKYLKLFFFSFFIITIFCGNATSEILFTDDYSWSGNFDGRGYGYVSTSAEKLNSGGVGDNGGCIRIFGGHPFQIPISDDKLELYIRFYAKATSSSHGQKWLKIFGERSGTIYANTTFGRTYRNGIFSAISYGEGGGDTTHTKNYNLGGSFFPASEWTCYEYHIKFAQVPEWNNGIYEVWRNGERIAEHFNVNNRSIAQNGLYISYISLSDYSNSPDSFVGYMWIDNVVIADEYIGPLGGGGSLPEVVSSLRVVKDK